MSPGEALRQFLFIFHNLRSFLNSSFAGWVLKYTVLKRCLDFHPISYLFNSSSKLTILIIIGGRFL